MRECRSVQVHECQRYLEVFPCGIVADPCVVADQRVGRAIGGRSRRRRGRDGIVGVYAVILHFAKFT